MAAARLRAPRPHPAVSVRPRRSFCRVSRAPGALQQPGHGPGLLGTHAGWAQPGDSAARLAFSATRRLAVRVRTAEHAPPLGVYLREPAAARAFSLDAARVERTDAGALRSHCNRLHVELPELPGVALGCTPVLVSTLRVSEAGGSATLTVRSESIEDFSLPVADAFVDHGSLRVDATVALAWPEDGSADQVLSADVALTVSLSAPAAALVPVPLEDIGDAVAQRVLDAAAPGMLERLAHDYAWWVAAGGGLSAAPSAPALSDATLEGPSAAAGGEGPSPEAAATSTAVRADDSAVVEVDDLVRFSAHEELSVPLADQAGEFDANAWLSDPENVLRVVFSPERLERTGPDQWRIQLLKAQLLTWEFVPRFDVTASYEDGVLRLWGDDDSLSLEGSLASMRLETAISSSVHVGRAADGTALLHTAIDLRLGADLPRMLRSFPGTTQAGNEAIAGVVRTLVGGADARVAVAYRKWLAEGVRPGAQQRTHVA